jgi:hypothetical protein
MARKACRPVPVASPAALSHVLHDDDLLALVIEHACDVDEQAWGTTYRSLSRVCRRFHRLVDADPIWRARCAVRWHGHLQSSDWLDAARNDEESDTSPPSSNMGSVSKWKRHYIMCEPRCTDLAPSHCTAHRPIVCTAVFSAYLSAPSPMHTQA